MVWKLCLIGVFSVTCFVCSTELLGKITESSASPVEPFSTTFTVKMGWLNLKDPPQAYLLSAASILIIH